LFVAVAEKLLRMVWCETSIHCFKQMSTVFFYREMSNVLGGGVELEIYAYVAAQTGATV
jgi:hypothetical protein